MTTEAGRHRAVDLVGDTATLLGAVTPRNQVSTYHFEYGTDAFDARTPDQTLTTGGTAAVDVGGDLTGLTAGVAHRFRLVATNATGTTTGPERTFTAGCPARPRRLPRSGAGDAGPRELLAARRGERPLTSADVRQRVALGPAG